MAGGELTRFGGGNRAAAKYSVEDAIDIFEQVLELVRVDESIYLLSQALNELDYYANLPSYLLRAFPDVPYLKELHEKTMSHLESRLAMASLRGTVKEATAIFLMKVRHGMVEKAPQQQAPPQRQGFDWSSLPAEKLEQIRMILLEAQNEKQGNQESEGWVEAEAGEDV